MLLFFIPFTLLVLLTSKRVYGCYFTPVGLYAAVWGVSFLVLYANPLGYNTPRETTDWVFMISYIGFTAGCIIASPSPKRESRQRVPWFVAQNQSPDRWMIPLDRYIKLLTYMGFMLSLLLLGVTIQRYGVRTILTAGITIRGAILYGWGDYLSGPGDYIRGPGDYFLLIAPRLFGLTLVYAAAALNLARFIIVGRINYLTCLPLISGVFFDLALQSRMNSLNMMVFYFCAYLLRLQLSGSIIRFLKGLQLSRFKKIIKKTLIIFLLITVLCFSAVIVISLSKQKFAGRTHMLAFAKYPVPSSVAHFVIYFTGPLAAFDTVYNRPGEHGLWWGRVSFEPFEYMLGKVGIRLFSIPNLSAEYQLNFASTGIFGGMNLYSYLRYAWDDFGFPGLVIIPFLLGYISTRYYEKARQSFSCQDIAFLLLFMNAIALSTIYFQFTNYNIFWTIPLIWFAGRYETGRPCKAPSVASKKISASEYGYR